MLKDQIPIFGRWRNDRVRRGSRLAAGSWGAYHIFEGEIIYIGKGKWDRPFKNRTRDHPEYGAFCKSCEELTFEFLESFDNEIDAFRFENNLIHKYKPRFNRSGVTRNSFRIQIKSLKTEVILDYCGDIQEGRTHRSLVSNQAKLIIALAAFTDMTFLDVLDLKREDFRPGGKLYEFDPLISNLFEKIVSCQTEDSLKVFTGMGGKEYETDSYRKSTWRAVRELEKSQRAA